MPGDDRLGFDDDQRGSQIGQTSDNHATRRGSATVNIGALEHTDLVSKRQGLHLESSRERETQNNAASKGDRAHNNWSRESLLDFWQPL